MRADRLVATLLLLQARQRVTAAEVAETLEVSQRTARRDLEALSTAGIPVYSQPGRGGGWSLLGGARTDLSGLTADEARTLFAVAGPAALSEAAGPELKAALRKLVRALPEPFRRPAEAASSSIVVDASAWGQQSRPYRPPHLEALQRATLDGEQVALGYTRRDGAASTRTVHPLGLVTKGSVWYLVAGTADGMRTFRLSRVTSVTPTGEPVDRPEGFDLREHWQRIVADVDELRTPARLNALADPGVVEVLQWMFGTQIETGSPAADGRIPLRLGGRDPELIARQIAGFGDQLEVVDPPEARAMLARIGHQLTDAYRTG